MNAQLVCHVRAGVTLTFRIKEEEAVVGRDPAIAVSVPVEGVSRQHARIRWDGKAYWLEDLKSTNGTFLNGRAAVRERLKHLDVIGLGKMIDLVFLLRAPVEAAASTRQGIVAASLVSDAEGLAPIEIAPGEMTLGRAPSNNVVADSSSVSKVHARIERSADQLLLEDLGSANGTFLNGARVMTTFLKDGDVLSLAGVESYRVSVTMGEVKGFGTATRMRAPVVPAERHRFAGDWKTRFDWDSGEREALEDLRRQIREREAQKAAQGEAAKAPAAKGHGAAKPAAGARPAAAGAKPAPAAAKPATAAPAKAAAPAPAAAASPAADKAPTPAAKSAAPPAPKPTAPPAAKPTAAPADKPTAPSADKPAVVRPAEPPLPPSAKPAVPPPKPPVAPPKPPAPPSAEAKAPAAAPRPTAPPRPPTVPPAPAAAPPTVAATPASLGASRPPVPAKATAILEVRLSAPGFELSASETGAHEMGRATDAPLRVNHPTVSRKHARIILADDRGIAYLQDAGGANGTRLNGKAIDRLAPLSDGDKVGVGEVELVVTLRRG